MARFFLLILIIGLRVAAEEVAVPDPAIARSLERLEALNERWTAEWDALEAAVTVRSPGSARAAASQMALSEDPELRKRAIEAIAKDGRAPTLRELLWALGDADSGVRAVALAKIAPISPAALLSGALDVLLENDEASVRALDLALPGLPRSVGDEFARIFKDTDQPVPLRRAAAYALGKMRVQSMAAALAAGTADGDPTFALSCARALFALRDTQSVPLWIPLLQGPDPNLAWLAIHALAELGGREAFAALGEVAAGSIQVDPQLQPVALHGLAAWPLVDCVPVLIASMSSNPGYRRITAAILRARTGVALGDTAGEWQAWYTNGLPPSAEEAAPASPPNELLQSVEFVPPELRGGF